MLQATLGICVEHHKRERTKYPSDLINILVHFSGDD